MNRIQTIIPDMSFSFLWLIFSMVLLTFSARAEQEKVIRIAMADDYAPFYFKTENGYAGISYELASHLLEGLGYTLINQQYETMEEVLKKMEEGEADVVVNLTETRSRKKIAHFTNQPHIYETQDLIVRSNTQLAYNGELSRLKDFRIGIIFGWTYGPEFDNADFLNKVLTNSPRNQLVELLAGQYDIIINNKASFLQQASELKLSRAFKIIEPSVYALPVKIAVSHRYQNSQNLIQSLNQALDVFLSSKKYRQLRLKYQFEPAIQQEPAQ